MSSLRKFILLFGLISIHFFEIDAIKCFHCDSSVNENCAILKGNNASIESTECLENCSVWIDGTRTVRGCESDKPPNIGLFENCHSEDGCNDKIFPEERMKCIKCSENDKNCFYPTAELLYPCRNYQPNDVCYTVILNNYEAVRGCLSDQDEGVNVCHSFKDECIKCNEQFCNLLSGKSKVECVECYDNNSCGYSQKHQSTKSCEAFLGRDNFCFAFTNQTTYIRGCLNDFPDLKPSCEENSEFCQICTDDVCNDMKLIAEFCVECDSTSCKSSTNFSVPTLCGEATYSQAGCYLSDKGRR